MATEFAELCMASRLTVPAARDLGGAVHDLLAGGFCVEPEYDGIRCQAMLTPEGWAFAGKLPSSASRPEYANFPSRCRAAVASLAAAGLPEGTLLDGKLVSGDGWRALLKQMTCSDEKFAGGDFRLAVFDIIEFGSDRIDGWPLCERRRLLTGAVPCDGNLAIPERRFGDDGLGFALELLEGGDRTVEGVVLKRAGSPYGSGNTKDWLVHRHSEVRNAVVLEVAEGRRKFRGMAGSIVVGQYFPDGSLRRVASLDGMTVDQRHHAWVRRRHLVGTVVSFVSQGRTPTSYRRPRLLCFRTEGDPASCS